MSAELNSLKSTRDSLAASIAAREAVAAGKSADFLAVTEQERARLRRVEARIAELSPAPAPTPTPSPAA